MIKGSTVIKNQLNLYFIFAIALGLGQNACTNKDSSTTSSIKFSLPNLGSQKTFSDKIHSSAQAMTVTTAVQRVMINVTGPNIGQPIVFIWEPPRNTTTITTAPEYFSLDVPKGDGRLIQVLIATSDRTSGVQTDGHDNNMSLYYGDATVSLLNSSETADITLTQVATAVSGDARLVGRYFNSDGSGPTGMVDMLFHPPNGSPGMIVDSNEVFAGWFDFFLVNFSGAQLSYRHRIQGDLFTKTYVTDPNLAVSSSRIKATRSGGYYNYYQSGTSTVVGRGQAGPRTIIGGFFGPGASGAVTRTVKFFSGSTNFSGLYSTATTTDTTKQSFSGSSVTGGSGQAAQSAVNCDGSSETLGVNCLPFSISSLESDASSFLVKGPFLGAYDSNTTYVGYSYNSTTQGLDVKWKMAPGTANAVTVPTVKVFMQMYSTNSGGGDHTTMPCDQHLMSRGYSLAGTATTVQSSENTLTITNVPQSAWDSYQVQIALCPVDGAGKAYSSYASMRRFGGYGGGSGPFREIRMTMSSNNVTVGACSAPITLTYYEDGVAVPVSPALTVNLNMWGPSNQNGVVQGSYYSDSTCTTPSLITSTSIPAGSSSTTVRMKLNQNSIYDIQATINGMMGQGMRVAAVNSGTPSNLKVELANSAKIATQPFAAGQCYPLQFTFTDANFNQLIANTTAASITPTDSSGTPGSFYTDPSCTTALSGTLNFAASTEAFKQVYFKPSNATGTYVIGASGASETVSALSYNNAANTITNIKIRQNWVNGDPNSLLYASGGCFEAWAQPLASNGAKLKVPAYTQATLSSTGNLQFASDSTCSNLVLSKTVSLDPYGWDGASSRFWLKVNSGATTPTSGTIQAVLQSPALTESTTFYLQPNSIAFSGPLQNILMPDYCHAITVTPKLDGNSITLPSGVPLAMWLNNSNISFYDNSSCVNPVPMNMVFANGGAAATATFYAKTNNTSFNVGASLAGAPSMLNANYSSSSPTPTLASGLNFKWVLNGGAAFNASAGCISVQIAAKDASASFNVSAPVTINAGSLFGGVANAAYLYYYPSAGTCSSHVSGTTSRTFTISSGQSLSSDIAWVDVGPFTGATFSANVSSAMFTSIPGGSTINLSCSGSCPATP